MPLTPQIFFGKIILFVLLLTKSKKSNVASILVSFFMNFQRPQNWPASCSQLRNRGNGADWPIILSHLMRKQLLYNLGKDYGIMPGRCVVGDCSVRDRRR